MYVCVYGMSAAGVDRKEVKRPATPINVSHILFYMIIFTYLFLNDMALWIKWLL